MVFYYNNYIEEDNSTLDGYPVQVLYKIIKFHKQIVKSNSDDNSFEFCDENFYKIIEQIDDDIPVALLAVVGAFRTGKSFLLDFFLNYLRELNNDNEFDCKNMKILEGSVNGTTRPRSNTEGFAWRSGADRLTTGIWMYNTPYYIQNPNDPFKKMAVLLIDTQVLIKIFIGYV